MSVIWNSDGFFASIQPAYNPIEYTVQDDGLSGLGGTPPVMYCDIYFSAATGFTYYKTITATSPESIAGIHSFWLFDISGICQEYQKTQIPDITGTGFQQTFNGANNLGAVRCYVKFRHSTVDAYGVITPGGVPPVQATVDTPAVSGDGWQTDTFTVVNAALQMLDSVQFESQLRYFRTFGFFLGGALPQNIDFAHRVYQLSYLKEGKMYANDYGQIPILCCRNAFLGPTFITMVPTAPVRLSIFIMNRAGAVIYSNVTGVTITLFSDNIYYVPTGIKNLLLLFPGAATAFGTGHHFIVAIGHIIGGSNFLYATPKIYIQKYDALTSPTYSNIQRIDSPKHTRLWFQNYTGHLDQLNFVEREEAHKVTSSPTETVSRAWATASVKANAVMSRNNVRSNDHSIVSGVFQEKDMPFIKQLMSTSQSWIEYHSIEGDMYVGGAREFLMPIVIEDAEFVTLQLEDRFEYRVSIKYKMSNEYRTIRN